MMENRWAFCSDGTVSVCHRWTTQLQSRFDRLKKEHAEEKRKLDEAKKKLEEDQTELAKRRQQMLTQSTGTLGSGHHTLTLGKNKKK